MCVVRGGEARIVNVLLHILYCYGLSEVLELEQGNAQLTDTFWGLIKQHKNEEQFKK